MNYSRRTAYLLGFMENLTGNSYHGRGKLDARRERRYSDAVNTRTTEYRLFSTESLVVNALKAVKLATLATCHSWPLFYGTGKFI